MEILLNIDPFMSDQNMKGLWRPYNDIEANNQSLKALGVKPEAYGAILASMLLGKLPTDLRLIVSHKITDAELTLSRFQEVLRMSLRRERTVTLNQSLTRHRNERSDDHHLAVWYPGQPYMQLLSTVPCII